VGNYKQRSKFSRIHW